MSAVSLQPDAELHVHLRGAMPPALLRTGCSRNARRMRRSPQRPSATSTSSAATQHPRFSRGSVHGAGEVCSNLRASRASSPHTCSAATSSATSRILGSTAGRSHRAGGAAHRLCRGHGLDPRVPHARHSARAVVRGAERASASRESAAVLGSSICPQPRSRRRGRPVATSLKAPARRFGWHHARRLRALVPAGAVPGRLRAGQGCRPQLTVHAGEAAGPRACGTHARLAGRPHRAWSKERSRTRAWSSTSPNGGSRWKSVSRAMCAPASTRATRSIPSSGWSAQALRSRSTPTTPRSSGRRSLGNTLAPRS